MTYSRRSERFGALLKNQWRKALVTRVLGRIFHRVDHGLAEPGELPARGIHRVLVCRPNHRLGNMVLLAPLLHEIEALYPGAEIDMVAGDAAASLFGSRFRVCRILAVHRRAARHPLATLMLLRQLRQVRYDLAIDAGLGSQSGRLLLALARARYKVGRPARSTRAASAWHTLAMPSHHAHRGVFLLRTAFAGDTRPAYPAMDIALEPGELTQAGTALREVCGGPDATPGPVVGIFTNATGAKRFDAAWWTEFVQRFRQQCPGVRIVDVVAAHGESQLGDRYTPFYTRNLRNLAAVIAHMQGFISGDCGVMHLGAATGTPTLGLFRTTRPADYGPYGGASLGVAVNDLSASAAADLAARWFLDAPRADNRRREREQGPPMTGVA